MARARSIAERWLAGPVPRQRPWRPAPAERPVASVPHGDPFAHVREPYVARIPPPHPVSAPPNPRKPQLVRNRRRGGLPDLFEVFPDLPRLPRPSAGASRRLRRRGAA